MLQHPRCHQIEPSFPGQSPGSCRCISQGARARLGHGHSRAELEHLQRQHILERLSWSTLICRQGDNLQQIMHQQPWEKAWLACWLDQLEQCGKREAEPALPESDRSPYSRVSGQGISIWEDQGLPWGHSRVQQGQTGGWVELWDAAQDVHGARQSSISCQCQLEDAELQRQVRRSWSSCCKYYNNQNWSSKVAFIITKSWTSWQSPEIKEVEKVDTRARISKIKWSVDRHQVRIEGPLRAGKSK